MPVVRDPIIPEETADARKPMTPKQRKVSKSNGIPYGTGIKVAGAEITKPQTDEANRLLDVAYRYDAEDVVARSIICAGIGESNLRPVPNAGGSPYHGVLQGRKDRFDIRDTEGMATCFINGGKGYHPYPTASHGGGAKYLAKENPSWGPGLIAVTVEGSRANFPSDEAAERHYGKHEGTARELIKAYGGGFEGGATYYAQQYNFQIGTENEPHESYWDGMNRLAREVRWRFFIDGKDVYFDSDMSLIRQQPALVLVYGDPRIIGWQSNWDERKIATEMTIDLVCEPFAYRAGEVFWLRGFGPLSRGSTAKLPGRWLVSRITRNSGSPYSSFTLTQPEKPLREPATTVTERAEDDPSIAGKALEQINPEGVYPPMTPKEIIDTLVLPIARSHDMVTGIKPDQVDAANAAHSVNTTSGNRSWHKGPPASAWAVDMSNGTSPTPQMDALAKQLIDEFDMPDLANPKATGGTVSGNLVNATHKGYDFQLIYRTLVGGNHYNHVHFGVRQRAPVTRDQAPTPGRGD